MAQEDISDLESKLERLPNYWQTKLRTFSEAQLLRLFFSQYPDFKQKIEDYSFHDTCRKALIAKRRNRVVAMKTTATTLLQKAYGPTLDLDAITRGGNAWEINSKAEHLAVITSKTFLPERRMKQLHKHEALYKGHDSALRVVERHQNALQRAILTPAGAAKKYNDKVIEILPDLYTNPEYWNKKRLNGNLKEMLKQEHAVWFNVYHSKVLEKLGTLQIQMREKTPLSIGKHVARDVIDAFLFDLLVQDLQGRTEKEFEHLVLQSKLNLSFGAPSEQLADHARVYKKFLDEHKVRGHKMKLRDIRKYHLLSEKEWVFNAPVSEDYTGIQIVTDEYFKPNDRISKEREVGRLLNIIHSNPDLFSANKKEIGKPKESAFRIYGSFAWPSQAILSYIDFPHPEILPQPSDYRGRTAKHREINYVQGLGRVLGSSIHLKPSMADEFWYLHGRDAHQFYKRKTNPLNISFVRANKKMYESFLDAAISLLSPERYLRL